MKIMRFHFHIPFFHPRDSRKELDFVEYPFSTRFFAYLFLFLYYFFSKLACKHFQSAVKIQLYATSPSELPLKLSASQSEVEA